jgi:hypothetical protein
MIKGLLHEIVAELRSDSDTDRNERRRCHKGGVTRALRSRGTAVVKLTT